MAYDHNGARLFAKFAHLAERLFLEGCVASCQSFVDKQDVRRHIYCDAESEPSIHASRISAHRQIDEAIRQISERGNVLKLGFENFAI